MVAPAVAAGLGLAGVGGVLNWLGAKEQAAEARRAAEQARADAQGQQLANSGSIANANTLIEQGGQAGNQALMEGLAGAGANIQGWGNLAKEEFAGGMGTARQDLLAGIGGAQNALSPVGQFLGYGQQAGGLLGQLAGNDPRQNWQQDPGYQFRQQQGEQAINRAASAMGGRVSGRTLQDLTSFNQDLASQEYGNAVNRGFQQNAQQMGVANQMAGLGGMGANAQGQLAGLLMGGGQSLGNLGQNYAQGMSGLSSNMGANLGNLGWQGAQALQGGLTGMTGAMANNIMGGMAGQNNMTLGMMNQSGAAVPYAGGEMNALGNMAGDFGKAALWAGMTGDSGAPAGTVKESYPGEFSYNQTQWG